MRAKEAENSVKKFVMIIAATLSLVVFIISIWIIIDCFKKNPDRVDVLYNYKGTPAIDYNVHLKPNNFYASPTMGKNKKYIASLIDNVEFVFTYDFKTNIQSDTNYSYTVDAIVSSEYEQNDSKAELWSKTEQLIPQKSETRKNSTGYFINERIVIDYNKYNAIAKKFKDTYSVSADTYLSIVLSLKSNTTAKDKSTEPINEKIMAVMPLNKTVTDVTLKGVEKIDKNVTVKIDDEKETNVVLLGLAIAFACASAPIAIIFIYKIFNMTNVSQYIQEQKRILRNYQDIIAEVSTRPDLHGLKIIEVKKFEDMINIEEELRVPIMFYELSQDNESWFVIVTDTQAYRYILRSNQFGIPKQFKEEEKEEN